MSSMCHIRSTAVCSNVDSQELVFSFVSAAEIALKSG